MELVAQIALEGGRDLFREGAVSVEPRDLVFVLDREQLEIIARDGLGEPCLPVAFEASAAATLSTSLVAARIALLVAGEEVHAA